MFSHQPFSPVKVVSLHVLQAWAFKGMNSEDPAIYYALAALYGLPWVFHDLRLDGFTGTLLLLSVLHLQARRVSFRALRKSPGPCSLCPPCSCRQACASLLHHADGGCSASGTKAAVPASRT